MTDDQKVETTALKETVAGLGDFVENLDALAALLEKIQETPGKQDPRLSGVDSIARTQADVFRRLVGEVEKLPDLADWEVVRAALGRAVEGFEFRHADPVERQIALVEKVYKTAWGDSWGQS